MRFQCGGAQELKWGSDLVEILVEILAEILAEIGATPRIARRPGTSRSRYAIFDQLDTMFDGIGSDLRNSHGHHRSGHGDLRPVKIKPSPSAGEP